MVHDLIKIIYWIFTFYIIFNLIKALIKNEKINTIICRCAIGLTLFIMLIKFC